MDQSTKSFLKTSTVFQSCMIAVALLLAYFFSGLDTHLPFLEVHWSLLDCVIGVMSAFFLIAIASRLNIERDFILRAIGPYLYQLNWLPLLALAALIGISEEMLFRGAIEPFWSTFYAPLSAAILGNLFFAILHMVSWKYVIAVFVIGMAHSLLAQWPGEYNLLRPIVMHTTYDFIAFLLIKNAYRHYLANSSDENQLNEPLNTEPLNTEPLQTESLPVPNLQSDSLGADVQDEESQKPHAGGSESSETSSAKPLV